VLLNYIKMISGFASVGCWTLYRMHQNLPF